MASTAIVAALLLYNLLIPFSAVTLRACYDGQYITSTYASAVSGSSPPCSVATFTGLP
ncbi:MAG: hypothetical protein JSV99_07375 [Planctomycetota bacterium]|nr:MAG: hypothetical protein JSV99_07375 [Planctomycetota bacterium]